MTAAQMGSTTGSRAAQGALDVYDGSQPSAVVGVIEMVIASSCHAGGASKPENDTLA